MNQKKSATLYGSLLCPLAVGHCALSRLSRRDYSRFLV